MPTVIIVHGAYGHPEENWFPWLKDELEKRSYHVIVPSFPTPEGQTLDHWMAVVEHEALHTYLDEESILIGHSVGATFILSLLETLDVPVHACFLVSGSLGSLGIENFDKLNHTFCEKEFDWDLIKRNCGDIHLFHSDNDPYVPLEKAQELAFRLDGMLHIVKGAGHFNAAAGYTHFERLLSLIIDDKHK